MKDVEWNKKHKNCWKTKKLFKKLERVDKLGEKFFKFLKNWNWKILKKITWKLFESFKKLIKKWKNRVRTKKFWWVVENWKISKNYISNKYVLNKIWKLLKIKILLQIVWIISTNCRKMKKRIEKLKEKF